MTDEYQLLIRTLRWTREGVTCEADQRHADALSTPGVLVPREEAHVSYCSPDMTKHRASRFRGLLAGVNYLSLDRPDLQFAAKRSSRHMAQPKVCDWAKITRIARCLINASQARSSNVDSDWAGDRITWKSTSCGAMC